MKLRVLRNRTAFSLEVVCTAVLLLAVFLAVIRKSPVTDVAAAPASFGTEGFEVACTEDDTGSDLYIPLPRDVHYEDMIFENRYRERELHVKLATRYKGFYLDNLLACNPEKTGSVFCLLEEDGLRLVVHLNDLYETDLTTEDGGVSLTLTRPQEKYRHVIVIDPHFREGGADVSLALAGRMKELCEGSMGNACKILLTRTDAHEADDAFVRDLVTACGASRFLRLDAPAGGGGLSCEVTYSDAFYIRGYGNDAFAADTARGMSVVENMQVRSVAADAADDRLRIMKIPAATLRIDGVRSVIGEDEAVLDEIALSLWAGIHLGCSEQE